MNTKINYLPNFYATPLLATGTITFVFPICSHIFQTLSFWLENNNVLRDLEY
jgi:hypothetical protein